MAAKRANIKEIILCIENKRDIDEIKAEYLEGLTFHYVKEMKEVLEYAVTKDKVLDAKVLWFIGFIIGEDYLGFLVKRIKKNIWM